MGGDGDYKMLFPNRAEDYSSRPGVLHSSSHRS